MFSDVLDFLKNNSAYGSAVMVFFITKVFSIAKERQSNIAHANAEYSNVLINYIMDGKHGGGVGESTLRLYVKSFVFTNTKRAVYIQL